jgi:hypothetical protein
MRAQRGNYQSSEISAPSIAPANGKVHRIPVPRAQPAASSRATHPPPHSSISSPSPYYPEEDDASTSTEESEEKHRAAQHAQERASAVPGFLNSLVQAPAQNTDFDTTVSSIAVGDIPYFPTARKAVPAAFLNGGFPSGRRQASPTRSEHSTDSLDHQPEIATQDALIKDQGVIDSDFLALRTMNRI